MKLEALPKASERGPEVYTVYAGGLIENNRAGQGLWYLRTRMHTPLIDGLGRATWSLTMPVTRSRIPQF